MPIKQEESGLYSAGGIATKFVGVVIVIWLYYTLMSPSPKTEVIEKNGVGQQNIAPTIPTTIHRVPLTHDQGEEVSVVQWGYPDVLIWTEPRGLNYVVDYNGGEGKQGGWTIHIPLREGEKSSHDASQPASSFRARLMPEETLREATLVYEVKQKPHQ